MKKILLISLLILTANIFSQTNLISGWQAGTLTGTGTTPQNVGWLCTPAGSIGWNTVNSSSGCRFVDYNVTGGYTGYTDNDTIYKQRIMYIRWDAGNAGSYFTYPVQLQAGKKYTFSWKYAWNSNASAPVLTTGISTSTDGYTGSIASKTFTCSTSKKLQSGTMDFRVDASGKYYLSIKSSSASLCGIGHLEIKEVPLQLESSVSAVLLNYYNPSQKITISGNGSTDPISLTSPANIQLSASSLTSAGGDITINSINNTNTNGFIGVKQGSDSISIPVAASFPADFMQLKQVDTLTIDGAWCWFNDPRAIYYKGIKEQTYFGWVTQKGHIMIAAYNHQTGEYQEKIIHAFYEADDHDNPAIFFRKDGRIIIYYSKHTTAPAHRLISTNPEDITSWGADYQFGVNVTYPYPFQVGDSIFVFYRGINWHPTLVISNDNGETLGTPVPFISGGGARPYTRYYQDKTGAIHIASTHGHPRNEATNKIYYVKFFNGKFYRSNGTLIKDYGWGTNPLNIDAAEAETIYDGTSFGKGWIWDITVDSLNNPVMVYASFPTDTDHRYHYIRWNGSSWTRKQLTSAGKWFPQTPAGAGEPEPNYSGGIILDPDDPNQIYLSKQINGNFEIMKFITKDKGLSWDSVAITWNTPKQWVNVRPVVPRNHKKGFFDVVWMKGKYTYYGGGQYYTSLVYAMDSMQNRVDSIKLSEQKITIYQGASSVLSAVFYPFIAQNKNLTWSSSDNAIASVINGEISAIKVGEVTITATTDDGKSASCVVTINKPTTMTNAFFDFGTTSSPVAAGAIQVSDATLVTNTYGWTSTVLTRDRGTGTDELRDFNMSGATSTFRVYVENGDYKVTLQQGDLTYAHDNMSVAVNGVNKVSGVNSALGAYTTSTFEVSATNNLLDFTFSDGGGSDANWIINSLKLEFITTGNISPAEMSAFKTMTVFDITGRKLMSKELDGAYFLHVLKNESIHKGIYLVHLSGANTEKTIKIFI